MAGPASALGYQQLTVSTTAVSVTTPTGGADTCMVRVATNGVRFRDDGTAPTAAIGVPLSAGDTFLYTGQPEDLQFIRSGAADATLDILYYNADANQYPAIFPGTTSSGGTSVVDTELPAAAALADQTVNPTTVTVGADLSLWDRNNARWQRVLVAGAAVDGNAVSNQILPAVLTYTDPSTQVAYFARLPRTFKSVTDASVTATTGVTVWTPAAGKIPHVSCCQLSLSVAGQIFLSDNVVGTIILRSPKLAAGGVWDFNLRDYGLVLGTANNVLKVDVSASGNVGGWVGGTEE